MAGETEKREEDKAGGVEERRRGEGSRGRCRKRRESSKCLGMEDASSCFHVPLLQEDYPSRVFLGVLWRGAMIGPPYAGLLQPE